jgi:ribosomal protein S12 methylthiotransferase accessory factor
MTNLFACAASSLLGDRPEDFSAADVRSLREALGYAAGPEFSADGGESGSETRHRALLLKAASRLARVFQPVAPNPPGLACFGAEFDPAVARVIAPGLQLDLQRSSRRGSRI